MNGLVAFPPNTQVPQELVPKIDDFIKNFDIYEIKKGVKLNLYFDEKSGTYYVMCHLQGRTLAKFCDTDASLDGDEEDEVRQVQSPGRAVPDVPQTRHGQPVGELVGQGVEPPQDDDDEDGQGHEGALVRRE